MNLEITCLYDGEYRRDRQTGRLLVIRAHEQYANTWRTQDLLTGAGYVAGAVALRSCTRPLWVQKGDALQTASAFAVDGISLYDGGLFLTDGPNARWQLQKAEKLALAGGKDVWTRKE